MEQQAFRAAILTEQRQPLVLDDVQLPERLDYGQVLVRVSCSGICGSQLGEIDGVKGPDRFLPHLLGHEGSGVVVETGPGVVRVKPGDSVVMHWRQAAGIESPTPKYRWGDREVNAGWVTTFNELAIVSENRLTPIPDDFPKDIAALLGCAVVTGLGVISNDAELTLGESIVVLGAGGVGLNVIQGAQLVSADPIVAVDIVPAKLALAKRFGATHVINSHEEDVAAQVRELIGSADVVVETTGRTDLMELAYELTGPQGRCVFVGVPQEKRRPAFYSLPLHFGKKITGSHGGESQPDRDIPRYLKLIERGRLDLEPLISDRFAFSQLNEAIDSLRSGQVAGRCVIEMGA